MSAAERSPTLMQDLLEQEVAVERAMPPNEIHSYLAGLRAASREAEASAWNMAGELARREAEREALSKAIEAGDMDIPD